MRKLTTIIEHDCISRREALATLAVAAVAACGGSTTVSEPGETDSGATAADAGTSDDASAGDAATCTPTGKNQGAVTKYAIGTWALVGKLIIAQDANGYFAFSAICTHQGCVVNAPGTNGDSLCACHGSRFDGNGAVLQGPAKTPLPHYAVSLCNGDIYVDTTSTVSAATRTPAA